MNKIAECIALWGKPEQAVHGMKERRAAASSAMKGEKETNWLTAAFAVTTYVTRIGGGCARDMYSYTSDFWCLSS